MKNMIVSLALVLFSTPAVAENYRHSPSIPNVETSLTETQKVKLKYFRATCKNVDHWLYSLNYEFDVRHEFGMNLDQAYHAVFDEHPTLSTIADRKCEQEVRDFLRENPSTEIH